MRKSVIELLAEVAPQKMALEGIMSVSMGMDGGGGTRNYANLIGKPSINGYELQSGDNTLEQIGVTQLIDNKVGNIEALLETI